MNLKIKTIFFISVLASMICCSFYAMKENKNQGSDKKINDIIQRMSLKQKSGSNDPN